MKTPIRHPEKKSQIWEIQTITAAPAIVSIKQDIMLNDT